MNKKIYVIIGIAAVSLCAISLIYRLTLSSSARKEASGVKDDGESAYLESASKYESKGDFVRAGECYQKIIEKFPGSSNIAKTQEALEKVNIKIINSFVPPPDSFSYEVQKGDTLGKLAKRFNTTIELIAKSNGIKDGAIRIGQRLKITKAKFSIVVDKSQNIMTLKSDDTIVKTYKVSTGKDSSTPVGAFKITAKIVNPT